MESGWGLCRPSSGRGVRRRGRGLSLVPPSYCTRRSTFSVMEVNLRFVVSSAWASSFGDSGMFEVYLGALQREGRPQNAIHP
jgi:hypothetical protein